MLGVAFSDSVYPTISVRQTGSESGIYTTLLDLAKQGGSSNVQAITDSVTEIERLRKFFSAGGLSPATGGFIDRCFELYAAAYIPAMNVAWTAPALSKKVTNMPITWSTVGMKKSASGGPCAHVDVLNALYNMGAYEVTLGVQAVTMQVSDHATSEYTEQCASRRSHFLRAAYYFKSAAKFIGSLPQAIHNLMDLEYTVSFFEVLENLYTGMAFESVLRAKIPDALRTLTRIGNQALFATICSLSRAAVHYYKVADHLLDAHKELKKVLEPVVIALVVYKRAYYYSFAYYYVGLCMRTDAKYKEALDAFTEAKDMAQASCRELEKAPLSDPYKKYGMKHALEDLISQISKYLDAISSACTGLKPAMPDALIDLSSEKRKLVLETYSKVGRDLPKIGNTELGSAFRALIHEDLPSDAPATYAKLTEYLDELIATEKKQRSTVSERNLALAKTCATICAAETNKEVKKCFFLVHNIFANHLPCPLDPIEEAVVSTDNPRAAKLLSRLTVFKKDTEEFKQKYKEFSEAVAQTGKFPLAYQNLKTAIQNTTSLQTSDQERTKKYTSKYWNSHDFQGILVVFLKSCKDLEMTFKDIGLTCVKIKDEFTAEKFEGESGKFEQILGYKMRLPEIDVLLPEDNVEDNGNVDYESLSFARKATSLPLLLKAYAAEQPHPKFVTYAYSLAAQAYELLLGKYNCTLIDLDEDEASIYNKAETKDSKVALVRAQERVKTAYKEMVADVSKMCEVLEVFLNDVGVQQTIISQHSDILSSFRSVKKTPVNEYEKMDLVINTTTEKMHELSTAIDQVMKKIDDCSARAKKLLEDSVTRTNNYNSEVNAKAENIKLHDPITITTQ